MVIVSPFLYTQELTTTNMEEYVDYLKGKIQECELEDMHVSVSVYKEVLNTYLSFLDAAKLKASLHKVGIVSRLKTIWCCQICRLYGMMKPAVHIMVGSKEMHDNMEKHLLML
jgi:hypothetical protein